MKSIAGYITLAVAVAGGIAVCIKGRGKPMRWYREIPLMAYRVIRHRLVSRPRTVTVMAARVLRRLRIQFFLMPLIRSRNDAEWETRLYVHRFVRGFLRKRRESKKELMDDIAMSRKVWFYWGQGEEQMPPVVRACFDRLHRTNIDNEIVLLHDDNIGQYVTIPEYVRDKIQFNKTHFSDILRVSLLAKYGGIWIDATCYCRESVAPLIALAEKSGFFAYRRTKFVDRYMVATWLMASQPQSVIAVLLRDALYAYWAQEDALSNPVFPNWDTTPYFLIHFIFEALYNLDHQFRQSWDRTLHLNAYDPHALQRKLLLAYDDKEWMRLMSLSVVHKLTYRISVPADERVPSYLSHILAGK